MQRRWTRIAIGCALLASVQAAGKPPQEPPLPVKKGDTAQALFTNGMRHFEAKEYPLARAHFKAVIERFPADAEDARYFYAVTFYREQRWEESIAAFDELIRAKPAGDRWVAAAYYHLGRSKLALQRVEEARQDFRHVLEHFPNDTNMCALAKEALAGLSDAKPAAQAAAKPDAQPAAQPDANRGLLEGLRDWWRSLWQ